MVLDEERYFLLRNNFILIFFLNIYIYYLIVVAELEESRLREGKRNGSEMNLWNKVIRLLGIISRK